MMDTSIPIKNTVLSLEFDAPGCSTNSRFTFNIPCDRLHHAQDCVDRCLAKLAESLRKLERGVNLKLSEREGETVTESDDKGSTDVWPSLRIDRDSVPGSYVDDDRKADFAHAFLGRQSYLHPWDDVVFPRQGAPDQGLGPQRAELGRCAWQEVQENGACSAHVCPSPYGERVERGCSLQRGVRETDFISLCVGTSHEAGIDQASLNQESYMQPLHGVIFPRQGASDTPPGSKASVGRSDTNQGTQLPAKGGARLVGSRLEAWKPVTRLPRRWSLHSKVQVSAQGA